MLYRMVPLVPLQKKLYISVLRKELQTLLSFTTGASSHQSLQNIVCNFILRYLMLNNKCAICFNYSAMLYNTELLQCK